MYLYKITMPDLVYYGITTDLKRRKREHLNLSSNVNLRNSIEKYGKDHFNFEIIAEGNDNDIYEMEKAIIKKSREEGQNIANISKGGEMPGGMPGEYHWNAQLSEDDVVSIRELASSNTITHRDIAKLYDIGYKAISKIVRGERWVNVGGPITLIKQQISKVANRRKLSDSDVIDLRNTCKYMYDSMGKFSIPEIAEIYQVARGNIRSILKGTVYANLEGPLLGKDYWMDYGRRS